MVQTYRLSLRGYQISFIFVWLTIKHLVASQQKILLPKDFVRHRRD